MNDDEDTFVGKINNLEYSLDNGITWNIVEEIML